MAMEMDSRFRDFPLWKVFTVILGAPALYVFMFAISRVSFVTFSNYAFIAGMVVEYVFLGIVMWFLHQEGKRLTDIGFTKDQW